MLLGIRDQLVGRRTQLSNTIRGHAAEFGLIEAKGLDKLGSFLAAIEQDESVPVLARELFAMLACEYARVQVELKAIEVKLLAPDPQPSAPALQPGSAYAGAAGKIQSRQDHPRRR